MAPKPKNIETGFGIANAMRSVESRNESPEPSIPGFAIASIAAGPFIGAIAIPIGIAIAQEVNKQLSPKK